MDGDTTTLGRGGSDYTASVFGSALDVKEIEIWTDVDGMMTADPRKVSAAFTIPSISYAEAMELTHFGAKVIYPPSLQPAFAKNIPIRVLNTFNAIFKGTVISKESTLSPYIITGISSIDHLSLVNLQGSGMIGVAGVSAKLFTVLAREKISVILISQASSEHSICFAIEPQVSDKVKAILLREFSSEIESGDIEGIDIQKDLSVIAVVGEGMRNHTGVSGKLFSVFAFAMGVPSQDIEVAGALMGKKMVVNEFVAYLDMVHLKATLDPKTIAITSFALCGFANFSSVAIQIGGIGELAPSRRSDLAKLGFKALIAGTLASYLSATLAGLLL